MILTKNDLPPFGVVGYVSPEWVTKLRAAAAVLAHRTNDSQFYEYADVKSHVSQHFPIKDGGYKYIAVTDIAQTLKAPSFPGLSPRQMYKLAARGKAPHLDDRNYTELKEDLPESLRHLLTNLGPGLSRTRFATLAAHKSIETHIDNDAHHTVRLHIPLVTNPDCVVTVYPKTDLPQRTCFEVGKVWFLNSALPHRVDNRGTEDRSHLIVNMNNHDLLKLSPSGRLLPTLYLS